MLLEHKVSRRMSGGGLKEHPRCVTALQALPELDTYALARGIQVFENHFPDVEGCYTVIILGSILTWPTAILEV